MKKKINNLSVGENNKEPHIPVLLKETMDLLNIKENKNYIDATLGAGGHSYEILKMNGINGKVLGIDKDNSAILLAEKKLLNFKDRFITFEGSYCQMDEAYKKFNLSFGQIKIKGGAKQKIDGIIFDLGMSSMQLENSGLGFSFMKDEPLDMRFGKKGNITAEFIINKYDKKDIEKIFLNFGQERYFKKIVESICEIRKNKEIKTTMELVDIISKSVPKSQLHRKTHCATKVFQALRIAVNNEFEEIKNGLNLAFNILQKGGRIAVITFHSLEDALVKSVFKELLNKCVCPPLIPICSCQRKQKIKLINKKVITPTQEEIKQNPRSRSAKLRVVEKL